MSPGTLLAVYCLAIVVASLAGGWLPLVVRLTHVRLQVAMSCVAGLMLGVGLLHLLPHAATQLGSLDEAVLWMLVGLLGMFFLVRAFHFHQHAPLEDDPPHDHEHHHHAAHDHGEHRAATSAHAHGSHGHGGDHHHQPAPGASRLGWLGIALGLGLHTLIDGVALAASVAAEGQHEAALAWAGAGTFLAILLHKPLDALSITSLMTASGWTVAARQVVNAAFALMCPLGAALFLLSLAPTGGEESRLVGRALAFAAGTFLCISLGDLLPELQFHTHDRVKLSAALLAGVLVAWGIGLLESHHVHFHGGLPHLHEAPPAGHEPPPASHDPEAHPEHPAASEHSADEAKPTPADHSASPLPRGQLAAIAGRTRCASTGSAPAK